MTKKNIVKKNKKRHWIIRIIYRYVSFFQWFAGKILPKKIQGKSKTVKSLSGILFALLFTYYGVPKVYEFCYDAVAFNVLAHEETLVFGKGSELSQHENVFRISACKKFPCQAQVDSVEYRIRDSLYLDLVWLFTKGEPYDPDELNGAFLSEQQKCTIKTYGRRIKYLGWYPTVIEAVCEPV